MHCIKHRILYFFLIFCFLFSTFIINTKASSQDGIIDFSKEGSITTKELNVTQFLELITNNTLPQSEKDYLSKYGVYFKYEDVLSSSLISTSLNEETNHLSIVASPYNYTDINNNIISWVPNNLLISDDSYDFKYENSYYTSDIYLDNVDIDKINIVYRLKLLIKKDYINRHLNEAYDYVDEYVKSGIEEAKKEEYESNCILYNQYLKDLIQYEEDVIKYNDFLPKKEEYDKKLELYNQYLEELNVYNQELELYNQYLIDKAEYENKRIEYLNYLEELRYYNDHHEQNEIEYNNYISTMEIIYYQLQSMELIKHPFTSLNRTVYDAVLGSTVGSVLERQEELIEYGADRNAINNAGKSTTFLRECFTRYFSLTSPQEKYSYYSLNYANIKKNIMVLFQSLAKLYDSMAVKLAMRQKDIENPKNQYEKKYLILVCSLALIYQAISDTELNDSNNNQVTSSWKIGSKTISTHLEGFSYDTTKKAYPISSGYPMVVTKLSQPEVVEMPKNVETVQNPTVPTLVPYPGDEIEVVNKPIRPTEVYEPVEYQTPSEYKKLLIDYNKSLIRKDEFDTDIELELYTTLEKRFRNCEEVEITFFNSNNEFINKYVVDLGSAINYLDPLPTKQANEKYSSFAFDGWYYENNEKLDITNVTKTGFVYPKFIGTLKEYEIKWVIRDQEITEKYNYGDLPTYMDNNPIILDNDPYYYEFLGWDYPITEVKSDFTYTALYNEFKKSFITWMVGGNSLCELYKKDELPVYKGDIPQKEMTDKSYFVFVGWDKDIEKASRDTQYNAVFKECYFVTFDAITNATINLYDNIITCDLTNKIFSNQKRINVYNLLKSDLIKEDSIIEICFSDMKVIINNITINKLLEDDNNIICIDYISRKEKNYLINIDVYKNEVIQENNYLFEVELLGDFDLSNVVVNEFDNEENSEEIEYKVSNSSIRFDCNTLYNYSVYSLYNIVIKEDEYIDISSIVKSEANTYVDLTITPKINGIDFTITILDEDNNIITLNNDYSFKMPMSDVFISCTSKKSEYQIIFVSNDIVISNNKYYYGDEVVVPQDPERLASDDVKYEFIGWDKDIETVTKNEKYVAMYREILIEHNIEKGKITIYLVLKILLIALIIFVPVIVVYIIMKKSNVKERH